jgi:hypothetical protein
MEQARAVGITKEERNVIVSSSLGTVFEWYDFYLYGSLAAIIGKHFFAGVNETSAFIFALLAFAAGFAVRPFGAIFFGRMGDLLGRKRTFLTTMLVMGVATFSVGVLPSYSSIGFAAPILLIAMRLLQGLALGGEYGGAATYVAEHAPKNRRGFFTSWIQITATAGLMMSLLVVQACRSLTGKEFEVWGWRIPFLVSVVMLVFSLRMRMKLHESPVFKKMKDEGKSSGSPLRDAFANLGNLKVVLFSLIGATAGQAVVWYTGQFYALYFLTQTLKLDMGVANWLIVGSLLLGTPFFVLFGSLSDRIGRKPIVLAGMVLAAALYFPLFEALAKSVNPDLVAASTRSPVVLTAPSSTCTFQFDPIGKAKFTSPCDVAKTALAKHGVPYTNVERTDSVKITIGSTVVASYDGAGPGAKDRAKIFADTLDKTLKAAGYPAKADPSKIDKVSAVAILTLLVIFVAMVYGPIAAWLVELFPARIRYSSMSLPYHIGNGWFGGFLPTVAFAMVAATGDIYHGLMYPVVVASICAVLGLFLLPETKDREIHHNA